jgi:hypothetical protein
MFFVICYPGDEGLIHQFLSTVENDSIDSFTVTTQQKITIILFSSAYFAVRFGAR